MGKIIVLDENTANKIAAGEVIERPASVVKELVENSIDAGATAVTVEIKNGGISYIKVTDNGSGISEDDAVIAFERHATSKIRSSADLDCISTLGFRGEALASIAAVANVQLTTRVAGSRHGTYVEISGGAAREVRQTGCPVGTAFVVKDLFFNTPARYKFLKKDTTEAGNISDIIGRIALGNPHISFRLISNNSTILYTPGNNDLLSVIYSVYGKDVVKASLPIEYADNKIKLSGYAGKPEISRSNRNYQSFYLNGRYIRSRMLSAAVEEAYGTLLMKNRHAFIVMNLEINPILVDVNVHPSKMEVRFSNEQDIFRSIYNAVNSALMQKPLIRDMQVHGRVAGGGAQLHGVNGAAQDFSGAHQVLKRRVPISGAEEYSQQRMDLNSRVSEQGEELSGPPASGDRKAFADGGAGLETGVKGFLSAKIIGQAFSTYIMLEMDDDLILIDQHAAHERILYEKLKAGYTSGEPMAQMLLTPSVIKLTDPEIRKLEEEKIFFERLGFTYDNFGNNSIILRSVPYTGSGVQVNECFLEVLDRITVPDGEDIETAADEALYTFACKAAVKANKKLDDSEIISVLEALSALENPYSCPHGRPTAVRLSKRELEKNFKRIV